MFTIACFYIKTAFLQVFNKILVYTGDSTCVSEKKHMSHDHSGTLFLHCFFVYVYCKTF